MKKKVYLLLGLAVSLLSVNVVTSCKDTEEDEVENLRNATYKALGDLQGQIDVLGDAKASVSSVQALQDSIQAINDRIAALNTCGCDLSPYYTSAQIDNLFSGVYTKTEVGTLLSNYFTKDEVTTMTENYATKQNISDSIAKLEAKIGTLIDELNAKIKNNIDSIKLLDGKINNNADSLKTLDDKIKNNSDSLKNLDDKIKNNSDSLKNLDDKIKNNSDSLKTLDDKIKNNSDSLKTLDDKIKNNSDSLKTLDDKIKNNSDSLKTLDDKIKNNSDSLKTLDDKIKNNSDSLKILDDSIKSNASKIKTLNDSIKANSVKIDTLFNNFATLDSLLQAVQTKVQENTDSINSLLSQVSGINTILDNLQTDVNALKDSVNTLRTDLDALTLRVDKLEEKVAGIEDELKVVDLSAVLIQGAYNPVFGYFNTPFGINSNVLMSYYGTFENSVDFPAEALSDAAIDIIGTPASETFDGDVFTESAGTLFLTFNPSTFDLDSLSNISIVNSKGEEAMVKLSTDSIKTVDETLYFGYTRAAASAPVYQINSTVEAIDESKVISFDKSLAKDLKNIVTSAGKGVSIASLASDIYKNINDVAEINAVKADVKATNYKAAYSVYSDFGIAATGIKPLSYDADLSGILDKAYDKAYDKVINAAHTIIDKAVNRIKSTFGDSIVSLSIDSIKFSTPDSIKIPISIKTKAKVTGTATGTVHDDATGTDETVSSVIDASATIAYDTTVVIKTVDIIGDLGSSLDNFNSTIADLNDYVGTINTYYDKIIDKSAYNTALDNILEPISNKIKNVIGKISVEPCLIVVDDKGSKLASAVKSAPSNISGTKVDIFPTSFTGEFLAPAYAKYIAVNGNGKTYKFGDKGFTSMSVTLNSGLNTIIYASVDYFGKTRCQVYYVNVE